MNRKRIAALAAAFGLTVAVAGVMVADNPGSFTINVFGAGAQQGVGNVSGACQEGQPVAATLTYGWDNTNSVFVVTSIDLSGILPACTAGSLVIPGNGGPDTFSVAPDGTASVVPSTAPSVGDFSTMALLLTQ